jgi:hypothetical protein
LICAFFRLPSRAAFRHKHVNFVKPKVNAAAIGIAIRALRPKNKSGRADRLYAARRPGSKARGSTCFPPAVRGKPRGGSFIVFIEEAEGGATEEGPALRIFFADNAFGFVASLRATR